jgi:hypothetical protein
MACQARANDNIKSDERRCGFLSGTDHGTRRDAEALLELAIEHAQERRLTD